MTPEGIVKAAVLDYLKESGRFYMRMNSGTVRVRGGMMHLCPVGTADILTFGPTGGCMWIELKHRKGEQGKKQVEFQEKVTAIGHSYVVARSVEDVVAAFKEAR
jgi:hypothetical protein